VASAPSQRSGTQPSQRSGTQPSERSGAQAAAPLARGLRLSEMLTLKDQTDVKGRLVLEDSAPKRAIKNAKRAGVAMKTSPCPYDDTPSRSGGLMNTSAYEALRRDTAEILNGFAWLTTRYLALDPSRRSTVRLLFDISYAGVTLPLVLFHRRPDPVAPHGALPTYVASICKASRGVVSASVDMLNKAGPPSRVVSAAEVVKFADEEGHLRRPQTERACAAPTRLIERTIEVILTGETADPDKSGLAELIDFDILWAFCSTQDGFSQSVSRYKYLLNELVEQGVAQDPNQLFAARVDVDGRTQTFGAISEAMVGQANATQSRLNRILGRSDSTIPFAFEDLLQML
jgi:hypothetical protein